MENVISNGDQLVPYEVQDFGGKWLMILLHTVTKSSKNILYSSNKYIMFLIFANRYAYNQDKIAWVIVSGYGIILK